MVLATSAGPEEIDALLAALDADDVLAVTTASDADTAKPAPDIIAVALRKVGVAPQAAVFVGDTVWDVMASGGAGVPCVALLSGGISAAELRDAGAAATYADVRALLADLDNSPLADVWTAGRKRTQG